MSATWAATFHIIFYFSMYCLYSCIRNNYLVVLWSTPFSPFLSSLIFDRFLATISFRLPRRIKVTDRRSLEHYQRTFAAFRCILELLKKPNLDT